MTKNNLLILLLFFCGLAFSQNCKYQKNEFDEFTQKKVLITKQAPLTKIGLGLGTTASVKGKKYNETKYLEFSFTHPTIFSFKPGDKIMLKTIQGNIIELTIEENIISDYVVISKSTIWTAKTSILLTESILKKLRNVEIIKIRWYTSDGYIEKEAKKKHYKNLSNIIKCIE